MRLGPKRRKNALDAAFSELHAVIVAHGGTVEKYIGDVIYALFGAPISHADDPCRALRVAFACLSWAPERDPADVPFSSASVWRPARRSGTVRPLSRRCSR